MLVDKQKTYYQKCSECSKLMMQRQQQEIKFLNQKMNPIKDGIQADIRDLFQFLPLKPFMRQIKEGDVQNKIDEIKEQAKWDFEQCYQDCFQFEEMLKDFNNKVVEIIEKLNMMLKELKKLHPHNFIKNEWKVRDKKYQQELCCCLAFNRNNSMLITGSGSQIKLWKFSQGYLIQNPQILYGHEKPVICLALSMKQEFIISGSEDKAIRIWRKQGVSVWTSKDYHLHKQSIMGMIFDEKINQLISWSKENVIRISFIKNYDLEQYQVLKGHTSSIDCVCLNEIETVLCSSGNDQKLIIWMKNQNMEWQFQYVINKTRNDYICRMSFLNQKLICLFWSEGIIQVFEQQNDKYIEKSEQKIQLNQECDGENLFPSIYNKQQNILIMKHNRYIYTLNDKLIQCCEPIDCNDFYCYGTLETDGKYLAVWDDSSKTIFIYECLKE